MTAEAPDDAPFPGPVHLVGVGGAGMSVVAALLVARGCTVSGSDARGGPVLDALRGLGVTVHVGHDAAQVPAGATVVVSSAVRADNPELVHARATGLDVRHRSEALAALMAGRRAVAVAGAHGKTTTSGMVAVMLAAAGLDPSWAVGGTVLAPPEASAGDRPAWPATGALGGARHGSGDVVVAEADESDGSFLAYRPTVAVVTNVEPDHLDHYGTREAFEDAFRQFAGRVVPGGTLVVCADDDGARRLADAVRGHLPGVDVRTYGTTSDADVRLVGWRADGAGSVATLHAAGTTPADGTALRLAVPGVHNALNATAAWAVGVALGLDPDEAAAGLARFVGTGRRFEERGVADGVRVVDDYAHHPTEVAALLRAARTVAGDGRVVVLFQPHLYSRTRTFAGEFGAALALADDVVVTDVYAAREDPEPGVTGALVSDATVTAGGSAVFVADRVAAAEAAADLAGSGDLLLTVGAGDVTELGAVVLDRLSARPGGRRRDREDA